jgi:sec-independent protein translocase protein TatC
MARFRSVGHEDRLTLVEHLDELRTRLIISVLVFAVAFGLCFWQNSLILDLLNNPLPGDLHPLTLSPTEPFMTTLMVSAYAAVLISLPLILYQLYAFVLPAFSPNERRIIFPILMMVPFLMFAGVAFGYFVVLPAALKFLLHFNADDFNIQLRAREYYGFAALTLVALGVLFQIPVVILGLTRAGITNARQLRRFRRHAIVVIAIIAMLLPGTDPITMLLSMVPLLVLYELSILLAVLVERSRRRSVGGAPAPEGPG